MRRWITIGLLVAVLGVAGYGFWLHRAAGQENTAVRQSLTTATAAAQAIFSYDYRSFDTSVANGQSFTTGEFAKEYTSTTNALKANAVKEQAIVRATVSASGVVTAGGDRVELMLFVNQYRRNTNVTGEKVDQNRVVLTMIKVGQDWKVSGATAL
jgi:Mce-associated membrane protein